MHRATQCGDRKDGYQGHQRPLERDRKSTNRSSHRYAVALDGGRLIDMRSTKAWIISKCLTFSSAIFDELSDINAL